MRSPGWFRVKVMTSRSISIWFSINGKLKTSKIYRLKKKRKIWLRLVKVRTRVRIRAPFKFKVMFVVISCLGRVMIIMTVHTFKIE